MQAFANVDGGRAWMDVRKGRVWTGVRVPVRLELRDGALVLTAATTRLDRRERSALVRLCGDEVLSTLIARRQEPEVVLPLGTTRFRYPGVPGLGRTSMVVKAEGRPQVVLTFVDPADTGSAMANPFGFSMRMLRAGPAARRTRDAWGAAIEAAAAPYRSSTVSS